MLFGKDNDKGLVLDGLKLKAVTIGQDGYTLDDILVHDATTHDNTMHLLLSMMGGEMPVALGVIRAVEAPVYGEELYKQMEAVQTKKPNLKLNDILMSGEVWQVKE